MTYCQNCGEAIEGHEKFCPYCGTPVGQPSAPSSGRTPSSSPTPAPGPAPVASRGRTEVPYARTPRPARPGRKPARAKKPKKKKKKKKKSHKGLVIGIFVAILLLGSFFTVFLLNFSADEDRREFSFRPAILPPRVAVDVDSRGIAVDVLFVTNASAPAVTIEFIEQWAGLPVGEREFTHTFTNTSDSVTYAVAPQGDISWVMGYDTTRVRVILRSDVLYDLAVDAHAGSVDFLTPDAPAYLHDVALLAGSGSIDFLPTHRVVATGNLRVQAVSGSVDVIAANCVVSGNVSVSATSGSVDARLTNCSFGGVLVWTHTGSLDFQDTNSTIVGPLRATSHVGSCDVDLTNTAVSGPVWANATTGSLDYRVIEARLQGHVFLGTSTGSCNVVLIRATLGGNLLVNTHSGSCDVDTRDLALTGPNPAVWNFQASMGSLDVDVRQRTAPGRNVTATVAATTGSLDFRFRGDAAHVGARFVGTTETGSLDMDARDAGFTEQPGNVLQSTNYATIPAHFDVALSTTLGSLEVDAYTLY